MGRDPMTISLGGPVVSVRVRMSHLSQAYHTKLSNCRDVRVLFFKSLVVLVAVIATMKKRTPFTLF